MIKGGKRHSSSSLYRPKKKAKKEQSLLQDVRKAAKELRTRTEVNEDIVVGHATVEEYLKFKDKNYKIIGCKLAYQDGKVIIYEVPSKVHGSAQLQIGTQLAAANTGLLNGDFSVTGPEDLIVDNLGSIREPDLTMTPRLRPRPHSKISNLEGDPYPTLVVEIGVSRSLSYLDSLAPLFFDHRTRIRLYLAIKIWPHHLDGTAMMVAMLYNRGILNSLSPIIAISFGTAPLAANSQQTLNYNPIFAQLVTGFGVGGPVCNGPGMPIYQIQLPTLQLYDRVPGGVPAGCPANIDIDLFPLQQEVLTWL